MTNGAPQDQNPFWRFSLALYGHDGVAAACLRLQDQCGLDVNLLLYCGWAAQCGVALNEAQLARLAAQTQAWREEVVYPLRSVRRALKQGVTPVELPDSDALRDAVKQMELKAEFLLQQALWRGFPLAADSGNSDTGGLALANLERYAAHAGVLVMDSLQADIRQVAAAVSVVSVA